MKLLVWLAITWTNAIRFRWTTIRIPGAMDESQHAQVLTMQSS